MFLLDEFYGFFKFYLLADEVRDVEFYNPAIPFDEEFMSLAVTQIDLEYYFTFITNKRLYEYKVVDIDDDDDSDFIFQF